MTLSKKYLGNSKMQNKYFGDISDFYKYYFLRNICLDYKLGINWCLIPNDDSNDGKHIITKKKRLKNIDEKLYKILEKSILNNNRNTKYIENGYFNNDTIFYNSVYEKYFLDGVYEEKAFNNLINQDIIFFDPDNGIEVPSTKAIDKLKYVQYRTILKYWNNKKSMIIFQFRDFVSNSIKDKRNKLIECLKCSKNNIKIIKIENVYYFCLINNKHKKLFKSISDFINYNKELKYEIIV